MNTVNIVALDAPGSPKEIILNQVIDIFYESSGIKEFKSILINKSFNINT